ncbi:hypothetical protein GOP47_0007764 [Adiantum capillus-veneris]|uniref:RCC1-like domain-containing protein n=1 Tax=Adiantum capillus-veneris TaxID=13818 RepID=A0A9D4V1C4_ADICA|nr:hypothetical protein GOP47_0007764 [Adiantum capillus-veneris]
MPVDDDVGSKPHKEKRAKEMGKQIRMVSPQRVQQDGRDRQLRVLMWGYLPASSPQRAPLLHPTQAPPPMNDQGWKSVCSGGCGFAMAISDGGKVNTWGSTGDLGQSYVTAGKHEERPEPFPLPSESPIIQAAAGWAHCAVVTDRGEVYTWGWRECVPASKLSTEANPKGLGSGSDREVYDAQLEERDGNEEGLFSRPLSLTDLVDPPDSALISSMDATLKNKCSNPSKGKASSPIEKLQGQSSKGLKAPGAGALVEKAGEEGLKKRRLAIEQSTSSESSTMASDENVSAPPCLVTLHPGVQIISVAAGGRHTLALSDKGQVWGWGYGGEGQLGLGTRIRTVSSPHPVPCFGSGSPYWQDIHTGTNKGINMVDVAFLPKVPGSHIKAVACGGRHSAALTDAGALLTFGWGLYGQCGQGSTDDEVSPCYVSSLGGLPVKAVAAGLWHTVCITESGDVYSFGGNQFGQLGTGSDQAELLPRLLDTPALENVHATSVSCGARHSAISTDTGRIFCWGWNKYGQLGQGDAVDRSSPVEVPLEGSCAREIACGWWHTLGLVVQST